MKLGITSRAAVAAGSLIGSLVGSSQALGTTAHADGYAAYGAELAMRKFASPKASTAYDLHGALRLRGESLINLDLDHGLTPSGQPLFTVPLADPSAQALYGGDMRLRTDFAAYAPGTGVAVKVRVDVLDNLAFGSTPEGKPSTGRAPSPAASPGQAPPVDAFRIKRAYGEALTPLGIVVAGRMGAHWGLGLVANGGDCADCDGGDAADRLAFVMPVLGRFVAASYDLTSSGPVKARRDNARSIDFEPTDNVHSLTVAFFDQRTDQSRDRRRAAGRTTVEYGAYLSHRFQDNDIPADYLPTAQTGSIGVSSVMARGYRATAVDGWARVSTGWLIAEAELAHLSAHVDQPSLIPGVLLDRPVSSRQLGGVARVVVAPHPSRGQLGVELGYASGDDAPGFGAFPTADGRAPLAGDLDGPQADLPRDSTVNNFRFHPDYRIDRILFREIIGAVTDAVYLRPSGSVVLAEVGPGTVRIDSAVIISSANEAASTPSGASFLGIEFDAALVYASRDGFSAALGYAAFLPGAGFDNLATGQSARAAQALDARLEYSF